jgi:hypothetical protein
MHGMAWHDMKYMPLGHACGYFMYNVQPSNMGVTCYVALDSWTRKKLDLIIHVHGGPQEVVDLGHH